MFKLINHNKPTLNGDNIPKIIFLVWAPASSRAENISKCLDAHLYLISYKFRVKLYSPIKYILLFAKTMNVLIKEKPRIIICQIPPIFCVLSAIVYLYVINKNAAIIIDAHTGAFSKPWTYLKGLNKLVMKKASMLIVTNTDLQNTIRLNMRLESMVLEDKIPDFEPSSGTLYRSHNNCESFKVAVISSFAYDEPLEEILKAAAQLPTFLFYITGDNSRVKKRLQDEKTDNVIFTGFLNYADYLSLLLSVDAIMVLTKRDKTMLGGAYESLALQKPLITSNWNCLRQYFNIGTVYVDNSTKQIISAVETVQKKSKQLENEMQLLKLKRANEWEKKFINFKSLLGNIK